MPLLLDEHVAAAGADIAIVDDRGALSWNRLGERVNRWVNLLTDRGLGPGDRLACVLDNRRETFEVLLACLHAGITVVPINWHLTEPEIAYILSDSNSQALVVAEPYASVAARAAARTPDCCRLRLVVGASDGLSWVDGLLAAEPLLAAADSGEHPRQCCGSVMLYTSGTTGAPKGVVNGLFEVGAPFSRVAKLKDYARVVLGVPVRERFLLDAPWYHSSQLFFALLALLHGCRLVIRDHFDAATTLAVIDREQITTAHLVPTQLVRLLRLDPAVKQAFSGASLRRVWHGGGPCPMDVKREMIDWWGPVLVEYYGATEGGAITLIDTEDWLRRPGSVGRAVAPNEILVVGEDGAPLPPGSSGRVFVRRKGRSFHYHNAPEKTRSAHLAADTFTFGDVGHLDSDGYLFLTGRAQDLIVSGGVNIYPAEVEAVLLAHPAVRDAAVVGVPDEEFGERVVAVIEREGDAPGDLAAVLDRHCRRSLAGFKSPRAYHIVDALPRAATGKLAKAELRDRYGAAVPAGREPA
ncbi:MAG TPA: AMP-binding protein [Pilimelia sp.]|nr:AMP-binding protein [Pilimelia sp.]